MFHCDYKENYVGRAPERIIIVLKEDLDLWFGLRTITSTVRKINWSKVSRNTKKSQKLYYACPYAYIAGSFCIRSPCVVEELVHFDSDFQQISEETEDSGKRESISKQN